MYTLQEPERLDEFYSYSIFKSLPMMDLCPIKNKISSRKISVTL
jgi:hypothetical protein